MTISDAFAKYETIYVCWLWRLRCKKCGFSSTEVDAEYSFLGSESDFESYLSDGLPLQFDSVIDQVSGNRFEFLSYGGDVSRCPSCQWFDSQGGWNF